MTNSDPNAEALQIVNSVVQQQLVNQLKWGVESCANAISKVSGLGKQEAKACALFATSTFIQPQKKYSAPLDIEGPTGTGKSQIMQIMRRYSCKAGKVITAKEQTFPVVRDKIIAQLNSGFTTILIEESDHCRHSRSLEEFIYSSYDRDTADMSKKTPDAFQGFVNEAFNIFTPMIEHRRVAHSDAANARRAIVVRTHPIEGADFPMADDIDCPGTDKMALICDIPLATANKPSGVEGGIWNAWETIARISKTLEDYEFMNWLLERMRQDSELLRDDRSFEPQSAIFGGLVACLRKEGNGYHSVGISLIVEKVKREYGLVLSNRIVCKELRRCEIQVKTSHGVNKAFPTDESLEQGRDYLGLPKEFLEE